VKSEADLTTDDWRLVHCIRAERHHERLKHKLTRPRRAQLEVMLPKLIEEARRRGIPDELIFEWRAYPARDENGDLSFGMGVDHEGNIVLSPPPKRRANRMRPNAKDRRLGSKDPNLPNGSNGTPTLSAGDLLAALEHELAQRVDGYNGSGP
jgi:hypothetical protein